MSKISKLLYEWVLNTAEKDSDGNNLFAAIFSNQNGSQFGHGMLICFILVIVVSALTALYFYKSVAKDSQKATKANYFWIYVGGCIVLCALNYLVMQFVVSSYIDIDYSVNVLTSLNMLKASAIGVVYYSILFGLWSEMLHKKTYAENIKLFSLMK